MPFNPLVASKNICDTFRRYILSTFETNCDIYNEQLKEILEHDDAIMRGPFIQISHNYPNSVYIEDLIREGILSKEFITMNYTPFLKRKLYAHQEEQVLEKQNVFSFPF